MDAALVDSLEVPGGNVSGTSDEVSAEAIMDLAKEITPGFKTIGALYSAGEDNSDSVIKGLKEYADKNGYEVVESTVTNTSEVQQAAQYLADKADVVYSPIDNTIASAMAVASETFNNSKVPFYVSADSMVKDGGLATYGIDYTVLGKETAKMVAQVLGGADVCNDGSRKNERYEHLCKYEDCGMQSAFKFRRTFLTRQRFWNKGETFYDDIWRPFGFTGAGNDICNSGFGSISII